MIKRISKYIYILSLGIYAMNIIFIEIIKQILEILTIKNREL